MFVVNEDPLVVGNWNDARTAGDQLGGVVADRLRDGVWKLSTERKSDHCAVTHVILDLPRVVGTVQNISNGISGFLARDTAPDLSSMIMSQNPIRKI